MNFGAINVNLSLSVQSASAQRVSTKSALPTFDTSRVFASLNDFNNAGLQYEKEWVAVYSERFSGGENGGKISTEELDELLRTEFGSRGARFVDSNPRSVRPGQNDIYIDASNRQKMANDSQYRAKVFALIERELTIGTKEFQYKHQGEIVNAGALTGSTISICNENASFNGIPYLGMCTAGPTFITGQSTPASLNKVEAKKGKSFFEMMKEMTEEFLKRIEEKLKEQRKNTAAVKEKSNVGLDIKA